MKLSDGWIIGFTEGEGCFYINRDRRRRKDTVGFCIIQKEKYILEEIKQFFGFGHLSFQPHEGTNGCWRYFVAKYNDQLFLKDFFDGRLRTETKRIQFERWKITLEKWGETFVEPYPCWTAEEETTLKNLRGLGFTYKEIAQRIGRTIRAVEFKNKNGGANYIHASGVEA